MKVINCLAVAFVLLCCDIAQGQTLFFDDFDSGARPEWGDELGNWSAGGGAYSAAYPNNNPPAYSKITSLKGLTDFVLDLDIDNTSDGGVFLRTSDPWHGVALITGGWNRSHNGFYWHIVDGGWGVAYETAPYAGLQGSDIHLRIKVEGDTYSAYVNHDPDPVTTLVTSRYASGSVALYDYSGQTFDNVRVSVIPEPLSLLLLASGLLGLGAWRKK